MEPLDNRRFNNRLKIESVKQRKKNMDFDFSARGSLYLSNYY